ncbi:outer membrane receptor for ferrienterochelin and colicins [Mesonia hippocampi]|uniref:Outer membrane receptor for ferrienterochelin and colicins n=1 Tax=Mesonia hippocampi TaxID=1628250 RepID=A0A840EL35_9FLAO|nr:TonB-dependent receptor plug domain-containing protein [Mesonia hippocampi]MBB4118838.1 outer membrane receptor for ferrienterochelin and colicins [Mesonia hippocampi]
MKYTVLTFLFFVALSTVAQVNDSTYNKLKEVVLTGQITNQQSIDKSVFEVKIINQEAIKNLAANSLNDVLTQHLNMNVLPGSDKGSMGIEQFGFDSEYVLILVDNVPVIGDQGFGNAIDISQINLDDIAQIEIVEGAMGVQYGANAVTGVINIITKKSSNYTWEISPFIQEETIGNEYAWFDKGKHIQGIKLGHNFSDKLYATLNYVRTDFQGFLNNNKGKNYFNPARENDGLRGYDWLPKKQHNAKALVNYKIANFKAFYRFEYYTDITEDYAEDVNFNYNPIFNEVNPTAQDVLFKNTRFYHHLNFTGTVKNTVDYNISASYQDQKKSREDYTYILNTKEEQDNVSLDFNTRKGFFSRGTFSNFLKNENIALQLGYEIKHDKGTAGDLSPQNKNEDIKKHTLNFYSGFMASEISLNKFTLRPGFRYMASSKFKPTYTASLSGSYFSDTGYQVRAIFGLASKLPSFEELYYYLVDSNHNVLKNEDLLPEKGKSVFLHIKKKYWLTDALSYTPKITLHYLDVADKIDQIVISNKPLTIQHQNIDLYKTWGAVLRNQLTYKNLSANLGIGFLAEARDLKSVAGFKDDFLYALQANANLNYKFPKWNTYATLAYKHNGAQYQYWYNADNDNYEKQKIEAFSWLDASVRKEFKNGLEISLGARNLLDVTDVTVINGQGSSHGGTSTTRGLGYGRSYFLKLLYTIKFK